jgi:hypothetical protein
VLTAAQSACIAPAISSTLSILGIENRTTRDFACRLQLGDDRSYFGRYSIGARYSSFPAGSLSPWCKTIWHNSPRLTAPNSLAPRPAPPMRRGGA